MYVVPSLPPVSKFGKTVCDPLMPTPFISSPGLMVQPPPTLLVTEILADSWHILPALLQEVSGAQLAETVLEASGGSPL